MPKGTGDIKSRFGEAGTRSAFDGVGIVRLNHLENKDRVLADLYQRGLLLKNLLATRDLACGFFRTFLYNLVETRVILYWYGGAFFAKNCMLGREI